MDATAKKFLDLFRKVKTVTAATVDAEGHPHARIVDIMLVEDDGMYIITAKGKPYYKQLVESGEIALAASCPDYQSLKFNGKVRIAGRNWLDKIFEHNPGLKAVYPGESRHILEVFHIYEGHGEWFDLLQEPIARVPFSYGDVQVEESGFVIGDNCISCGTCADACPQHCINAGNPYVILSEHCLQCGYCASVCPADAIRRLHA